MGDSQQPSEYSKKIFSNNLQGLDAYSRHKKFMKDYVFFYGRNKNQINISNIYEETKNDFDILKENHKFLRSVEEEEEELTWEQRVAKKYYDKLFKEYCIAELKYYKEGKIALRWRIEKEVISGKGQLICASTKCYEKDELKSWEVNFGYIEDGQKKNALVKIRLCPTCSDKLNYKTRYQEAKNEELIDREHKEKERKEKGKHKEYKEKEGHRNERHEKRKRELYEDQEQYDDDKINSKKVKYDDKSNQSESTEKKPSRKNERNGKSDEFDEYFIGLFD
ncbi:hypothetical protein Glove_1g28 [Diversispora epigaea]|uniref:Protein FRA10AC1 n=1 Tax=Diversispora epigaea TaxID=1348612 RepID=A0A397JRJ6_9GLOM|nr:hypothetical protein Glove_1g28 [Diversispora epigaea]